jgi:hypothetical protein
MDLLFLFIIIPLGISFAVAYFLALLVYKKLTKSGNKYPRTFRIITFIGSFLLVLFSIFWLILANIHLDR